MEQITNEALGKAVRRFRLEAGFSQQEAANVLHCCRSAYSYKECGASAFTISDLQLLSDLFRIPPEIFFCSKTYQPCRPLTKQIRVKRARPVK